MKITNSFVAGLVCSFLVVAACSSANDGGTGQEGGNGGDDGGGNGGGMAAGTGGAAGEGQPGGSGGIAGAGAAGNGTGGNVVGGSGGAGGSVAGGSGGRTGGAGGAGGTGPGTGGAGGSAAGGSSATGGGGGGGSGGTAGGAGGASVIRIVDHTNLALFDRIPDQYLQAARQMKLMFSDRSVGQNINESLDCLAAASYAAAPGGCKQGGFVFTPDPVKYNRQNWKFEFRMGTWTQLTTEFIQTLAPSYIAMDYDVITYQFSYLNVMDTDDIASPTVGFFAHNANKPDVYDLEAFLAQNPTRRFFHWTSSLARAIGTQVSTDFNARMRQYARDNNKILFDFADIESHTEAGAPCFDNRDGTTNPDDGHAFPAICAGYTTEVNNGHLTQGIIRNRVAKAMWIVMALVAGWNPQ